MTRKRVCRYQDTLRWLRWMAGEQLRDSAYRGVQRAGAEMIAAIDESLAKPCGCQDEPEKAGRKNMKRPGKLCACGRKVRSRGKCSQCYMRMWRQKKMRARG